MKKTSGVINNMSWKFAEQISSQLVAFVLSTILARLLEPSYYGLIAIVNIFISFANLFITNGFGSALIQKKNADVADFSSALIFNIVFSLLLYIILFFSAKYIPMIYDSNYSILTPITRILGISLVFSAINSVQDAYMSRNMMFRSNFLKSIISTITSASVGLFMAYKGYGVWSLVGQHLTNTIMKVVLCAVLIKEKPILFFSFKRVQSLFGFGSRILGVSLVRALYNDARTLLVGKFYSSADLAYYDKGRQFSSIIVSNVDVTVSSVLFPKLSQQQSDLSLVKITSKKIITLCSYLLTPFLFGLATVAHPLVSLLLTDKWLPCVPLLQLFCFVDLFHPIHTTNSLIMKSLGKSGSYLKVETFCRIIELIILFIVIRISVEAIIISLVILNFLFTLVNSYPNKKYINYGFMEQMKDFLPSLVLSAIMSVFVYLIGLINIPRLPLFIIQIVSGITIYIVLSIKTKNESFKYLYKTIKDILDKKFKKF